jgi:hypothetical protein
MSRDLSSLSSSAPEERNQKMTMSREPKKKSRDNDDEPLSSSLSLHLKKKVQKMTTSQEACCRLLQLKRNNQG